MILFLVILDYNDNLTCDNFCQEMIGEWSKGAVEREKIGKDQVRLSVKTIFQNVLLRL